MCYFTLLCLPLYLGHQWGCLPRNLLLRVHCSWLGILIAPTIARQCLEGGGAQLLSNMTMKYCSERLVIIKWNKAFEHIFKEKQKGIWLVFSFKFYEFPCDILKKKVVLWVSSPYDTPPLPHLKNNYFTLQMLKNIFKLSARPCPSHEDFYFCLLPIDLFFKYSQK
jgi:hypothetical protein